MKVFLSPKRPMTVVSIMLILGMIGACAVLDGLRVAPSTPGLSSTSSSTTSKPAEQQRQSSPTAELASAGLTSADHRGRRPTPAGAVAVVPVGTQQPDMARLRETSIPTGTPTAADLKIAIIGDQGLGPPAESVLQLIKREGAHLVLHPGDFDYADDPDAWDEQITRVLGLDFPYFGTVGNHDLPRWPDYQRKLQDRLARVSAAKCTGDLGVRSVCHYRGLFMVLSGAGTLGEDHAAYIGEQLQRDTSLWSICAWHKNQHRLQVGHKENDVGWEPYEACRANGAIIANAHEHSYERTKTLNSTEHQLVDPVCATANALCVTPGKTFVVVSGLGGRSIRGQARCWPTTAPYGCRGEWASIYTADQGATWGALFITFNRDGNEQQAYGYFKTVTGKIVDEFEITAGPRVDVNAGAGPLSDR